MTGACEKDGGPSSPPDPGAQLVDRGRAVYMGTCIACHNADPSKDGSIGPAVKGASLELLRERTQHQAYPKGYTPKRQTQIMPPLPQVEPDLEALYRFLNAP